jgi:hypothetical protein
LIHPAINGYPEPTEEELFELEMQFNEDVEEWKMKLDAELALIDEFVSQWDAGKIANWRKVWDEKPHLRQWIFDNSFAPAFEKWHLKNKGNMFPLNTSALKDICFL